MRWLLAALLVLVISPAWAVQHSQTQAAGRLIPVSNPSRITVSTTGVYVLSCSASFATSSGGSVSGPLVEGQRQHGDCSLSGACLQCFPDAPCDRDPQDERGRLRRVWGLSR